MKNPTTNPFPSLEMRGMAIRDQLLAINDNKSAWAFSIVHALLNKTHPLGEIIKMIMDQYNSAPDEVLDVIPQSTIKLIQEVYGKY